MIRCLNISNFQSHEESTLQFSDKVNIIVGSTDSGKTAILRSLNWIINNRPLGNGYRSNWGGNTSVKISDDCRRVIERFKNDKENYYGVNGEQLKAFDKEIPTEVKSILGFTEINLQKQLDAPFLLSETPGEVQRILNRISHLDKIDSCMAKIESTKRKVNSNLEIILNDIKDNEEELKKYEGLSQLKLAIWNLSSKEGNLELNKKNIPILKELIKKAKANNERFLQLRKIAIHEVWITTLIEKTKTWNENNDRCGYLEQAIAEIKGKNKKIDRLKKYETLEAKLIVISSKRISLELNKADCFDLTSKIESLKNKQENKIELQEELSLLEDNYHDCFPEICPLCGNNSNEVYWANEV